MRDYRAYTLVELLISMSVAGTLLVSSIGVVHRAMTIETAARETHLRLLSSGRFDGLIWEDRISGNRLEIVLSLKETEE